MTGDKFYDKELVGSQTILVLTTAGFQILPSNPRRMSLTFSSSPVGRYSVYFGGGSGLTDRAVNIPANSIPVILTRGELGSMIEQSVFAIGQTAGIIVAVLEVSAP